MRIWHEKLIPHLCCQHLLACWREALGCYSIIVNNKKGYRKHPQVKEFENCLGTLHTRLKAIRKEMIKRNYQPKKLAWRLLLRENKKPYRRWQSLEEQKEILKKKNCGCKIK